VHPGPHAGSERALERSGVRRHGPNRLDDLVVERRERGPEHVGDGRWELMPGLIADHSYGRYKSSSLGTVQIEENLADDTK
jgi:hypothetical protein